MLQRLLQPWVVNLWMLLNTLGCGVQHYIPRGPSLTPMSRSTWLQQAQEPVPYTGPSRLAFPVIPFQVFAVTYDEDIVVETTHRHWSLHEYARVSIGNRRVWIAKDTDRSGIQTITAGVPDVLHWFPEIPVQRRVAPFMVQDASTADTFDLTLAYDNPLGERVIVHFRSPRPPRPARRRNGSTFDHSAQIATVVLDIPAAQVAGVTARMTYDGRAIPVRRLLGVFPVRALLRQSQAGFVVTSMRLRQSAGAFLDVERPIPGQTWPTTSRELWHVEADRVWYRNATNSWQYIFVDGGLQAVTVSRHGQPLPLLQVSFSAPLPDFSRPFAGRITRHFVLDINSQTHGHGYLAAVSRASGATLEICPVAPSWFAARPLLAEMHHHNAQQLDVVTRRLNACSLGEH